MNIRGLGFYWGPNCHNVTTDPLYIFCICSYKPPNFSVSCPHWPGSVHLLVRTKTHSSLSSCPIKRAPRNHISHPSKPVSFLASNLNPPPQTNTFTSGVWLMPGPASSNKFLKSDLLFQACWCNQENQDQIYPDGPSYQFTFFQRCLPYLHFNVKHKISGTGLLAKLYMVFTLIPP